MEARRNAPWMGLAIVLCTLFATPATAQFGRQREHVANSQNFIVFASNPTWAAQVAEAAEEHRRALAIYWLGAELPPWSQRCPIHVQAGAGIGAGGETRFTLMGRSAGNWMMSVQGTEQRVLDSVLPHEITHTIFATHFAPYNKYVPRWADEGACTTVEHEAEKSKHEYFLQEFLRSGRGISFNKMFTLKDYPHDILPLYAQGHSVVQFLLEQGGSRKFVNFLEDGMRTDSWEAALNRTYGYETLGHLQTLWNKWLADGSPTDLVAYAPGLQSEKDGVRLASNTSNANVEVALASTAGATSGVNSDSPASNPIRFAIGNTQPAPVMLANNSTVSNNPGPVASSGSYYRQRLREVSGGSAQGSPNLDSPTKVAFGSSPDSFALQSYQLGPQSAGRPQPAQGPAVQVLDWGNSQPISGIQPNNAPMLR